MLACAVRYKGGDVTQVGQETPIELELRHAWMNDVCARPWEYGFLSLLRRIDARTERASLGYSVCARGELVRLGQQPGLEFASSELASASPQHGRFRVVVKGLGMFGPHGALPLHMTEIAYKQLKLELDSTLVDFLDLFHHRFLTLFYRAWASGEATAGLDHSRSECFSFYVASLIGHHLPEIDRGAVPRHARLFGAPHLVRHARNPDGLRSMLEHYFDVPVRVLEHVFRWIELEPIDRGRLGVAHESSVMGKRALLGESIPDKQHRFRIVLGPLDLPTYLDFIPGGKRLPDIVHWVRAFVGYEFIWELELQIRGKDASPTTVGAAQCLGWSGWLGYCPTDELASTFCFEPESYIGER